MILVLPSGIGSNLVPGGGPPISGPPFSGAGIGAGDGLDSIIFSPGDVIFEGGAEKLGSAKQTRANIEAKNEHKIIFFT